LNKEINNKSLLFDLGLLPISNRFLKNKFEKGPKFPFKVDISERNGLISLNKPFPVHEIKPRFDWITCSEPEDHLDDLVDVLIQLPGISKKSVFASFSFKDMSTLERLKNKGFQNQWSIDPEEDLEIKDKKCSIETFQSKFNLNTAVKILGKYGLADIVIVRHVLEHSYNINNFVNSIKKLIKKNGYIVWELPDCEKSLKKLDYTMLWEEHTYYFTEFTLKYFLENHNFKIVNFFSIPYSYENSLVAIVKNKEDSFYEQSDKFHNKLKNEILQARFFAKSLNDQRKKIREKLIQLKKKNSDSDIVLYGAGHLSVAFISIMQLSDIISFVIDDNLNKKEMIMPIGNIPITNLKKLYEKNVKICLLSLNPENHSKIIDKNKDFIKKGGIFLSIFPGSNFYFGEQT
jgi:hypothetical protein